MEGNTAWGIDLGLDALDAVQIHKVTGRTEIIRVLRIPYSYSVDGLPQRESSRILLDALSDWKLKADLKSWEKVGLSISGLPAISRPVRVPPLSKHLNTFVELEMHQNPPFLTEETVYRYQTLPTDDMTGRRLLLVTFPRRIVDGYLDVIRQAEIPVANLQAAPAALLNLLRFDIKDTCRTLVVNLRRDATDIILGSNKGIWFRTLAEGCAKLAPKFQKDFGLREDEARAIAEEVFQGAEKPPYSLVADDILEEVSREAQNAIDRQMRELGLGKPEKVFILGEGSRLPGVLSHFSQKFQCWVERINKSQRVRVPQEIQSSLPGENPYGTGAALGCALQALGAVEGMPSFGSQPAGGTESTYSIPTLPVGQPRVSRTRPTNQASPAKPDQRAVRLGASILLTMAGILALASGLVWRSAQTELEEARFQEQQAKIQKQTFDQYQALQQEIAAKTERRDFLAGLSRQDQTWEEQCLRTLEEIKSKGKLIEADFVFLGKKHLRADIVMAASSAASLASLPVSGDIDSRRLSTLELESLGLDPKEEMQRLSFAIQIGKEAGQ